MPTVETGRWGADVWATLDARNELLVGSASWWTTRTQARAYIGTVDGAIRALLRDIEQTLVTDTPESLEAQAGQSNVPADRARELRDRAAEMRKRAEGKAPDRVRAEREFTTTYRSFFARWDKFQTAMQGFDLFGPSPGQAWEITEAYDSEYRRYLEHYKSFGLTPTSPPPPTPNDVTAEHAPPAWSWLPQFEIPKSVFLIGGAAALFAVWSSRRR